MATTHGKPVRDALGIDIRERDYLSRWLDIRTRNGQTLTAEQTEIDRPHLIKHWPKPAEQPCA